MAESLHSGNSGNFAEDREKAVRAGHIGGQHSSGNFANNRARAVEAGRKGGLAFRRPRGGEREPVLAEGLSSAVLDGRL
jgi:hypothetical protein